MWHFNIRTFADQEDTIYPHLPASGLSHISHCWEGLFWPMVSEGSVEKPWRQELEVAGHIAFAYALHLRQSVSFNIKTARVSLFLTGLSRNENYLILLDKGEAMF